MTTTLRSVSLLIAAAALLACATNSTPPGQAPAAGCRQSASAPCASATNAHAGHGMMGHMDADCPLAVAGTSVRAVDLEGAVALEFVTTGNVDELRRRVAHMSAMHAKQGAGDAHGMMDGGMMGGHDTMDGGMMGGHGTASCMLDASARAEEIPGGARLVLTPRTPDQLEALRRHVQEHAASGHCPMMAMHEPSGS